MALTKVNKAFSLSIDVIQQLEVVAKETARPMSHLVQDACLELLRRHGERRVALAAEVAKKVS